jgi:hypothetical protein
MAVTVTQKIKSILATQKKGEALGSEKVLALLEETKRQIIAELATAQGGSYSAYHLKSTLNSIEHYLSDWQSAATREIGGGLDTSWSAGAGLLAEATAAAGVQLTTPWLSSTLLDSLKEFAFGRISAVGSDAFNKIKGELTMGILGQKTPQDVAAQIAGNLSGPSIFKSIAERSEVVTGLEMGRAFSMGTQKSMEASAGTLPELKRMWLHAGHPGMPRAIHLALHGETRGMNKPFYQGSDGTPVMYPRDPNAGIKEVIRCGCTHVPWMEAFGEQKAFAMDFDTRQLEMWKKQG